MSTSKPPKPPPEPTLEEKIHMTTSFHRFLHYGSYSMLLLGPALIALPPRKLDLYTFSLAGLTFAATNHVVRERTGASLWYKLPGTRLPPLRADLEAEQNRRLLEEPIQSQSSVQTRPLFESQPRLDKQLPAARLEHEGHGHGTRLAARAEEIWRGGEPDDWKQRRLAEEQRRLADGEGYWDMIVGQVWEVWNWGEQKAEGLKEVDGRVVKEREVKARRDREFPEIGK